MSLTLYFYKVNKGKQPNFRSKEWFCVRRAYNAFNTIIGEVSPVENNNDAYKVDKNMFEEIKRVVFGIPDKCFGIMEYDDEIEYTSFKQALAHRKIDWNKYDLYVLNA